MLIKEVSVVCRASVIASTHYFSRATLCERNNDVDHISEEVNNRDGEVPN
jgi:hypothetical protein